jgi:hypothetical protein
MATFSGANVRIEYGIESTFGTLVTTNSQFGVGETFNYEAKNNIQRIHGIGQNTAQALVPTKFEGTWNVDFMVDRLDWLKNLYLNRTTSATVWTVSTKTRSATIVANVLDPSGGGLDRRFVFTGCLPQNATLTAAVGEVVKGKMSGIYQDVLADSNVTSLGDWSVGGDNFANNNAPLTFAQGEVYIGGNTTPVGIVQNFEISHNTNAEGIHGLGSRTIQAGIYKQHEFDVKMEVIFDPDDKLMEWVLTGDSTTASPATTNWGDFNVVFEFNDYDTSSNELGFKLDGVKFDTYGQGWVPNEVIKATVSGMTKTLKMDTNSVWV